ncbi:MAG TPA: tetratricopeptide repeat protein, partial [Bryobacteraceae bacterium]|nr:tetratricopeptide repeat protein [Bryobacteraceae bacterium]
TLPAAAVCIAGLVFISRMTPPTFAGGSGSGYFYRITQPWVLLGYFRKFFIPSGFTADTDRVPLPSLLTADALAGLLFLAILIAAIRWCIGRRELRAIAFGLLWFLAASLPTSVFALAEVENDHRMYFPFVGLALATSSAGALLVERMRVPARILAPILALLIAGLAWGTRERNRVWSTEESLWRDVSVKSPRNGRGLMNYGLTLMAKGDYTGALGLFNRALVFTPNYYVLEINLAIAYGAIGDPEKAEQHFTRAISLAPNEASPYFFYGRWVFGLRRTPQAISQLQIATRLNPDYLSAHYLLMQLLADSGDAAGLKTEAQSVLARFPGDAAAASWLDRAAILPPAPPTAETADGYVNQSLNFFHAGKFSDCIDASRKAIKLDPNDAQAWNNMGACYNSLSRWDQGIAAEREAVRLQPGLRLAQNNLAWAREQKRNAGK